MTKFIELIELDSEDLFMLNIDDISTIKKIYDDNGHSGCKIMLKSKSCIINVEELYDEIQSLIYQAQQEQPYQTK